MPHDSRPDTDDEYLLYPELHQDAVETPVAGVSAWGISLIVHALLIALMAFVVFIATVKDDQIPLQLVSQILPTEQPEKESLPIPVETTIDVADIVVDPILVELDLPVETLEEPSEEQVENAMQGREDAVALSEMGNTALFMAMGAGSGSSGAFGQRNPDGRRLTVGEKGGTPGSERAVEGALRWFVRHQSHDGVWDVDGYPINCQEGGPKCEPGTKHTNISGDVACTGYALLCFLGAGYDHRSPNRYQMTVQRGIDWLLVTQDAEGVIGKRNYEHPVAAMALAEAYAMTNDPALREPTQRAVQVILDRQTPDPADSAYALGWDYTTPKLNRMDSSVSGWNVMALKSAKAGGIDVANGLIGAERWLEGAWKATCAHLGLDPENLDPYAESQFPYTWNGETGAVDMHNGNLTCVGLLSAVFLGRDAEDPMLKTMANWCFKHQTPVAWPTDTYYLYYNTLGMFQVGGEQWQVWNNSVRDLLVDSQRREPGCFAGSWDPQGAGGHGISEVGRLLVTAYCALSLEVYYRYQRQSPLAGAAPVGKSIGHMGAVRVERKL